VINKGKNEGRKLIDKAKNEGRKLIHKGKQVVQKGAKWVGHKVKRIAQKGKQVVQKGAKGVARRIGNEKKKVQRDWKKMKQGAKQGEKWVNRQFDNGKKKVQTEYQKVKKFAGKEYQKGKHWVRKQIKTGKRDLKTAEKWAEKHGADAIADLSKGKFLTPELKLLYKFLKDAGKGAWKDLKRDYKGFKNGLGMPYPILLSLDFSFTKPVSCCILFIYVLIRRPWP
jgi:hypothetical protein